MGQGPAHLLGRGDDAIVVALLHSRAQLGELGHNGLRSRRGGRGSARGALSERTGQTGTGAGGVDLASQNARTANPPLNSPRPPSCAPSP